MTSQLKRGILEICILKLVSEKDMYGFQVINKLAAVLDVNENTIYPILRRLSKQGLFTSYLKESPHGAARKYFQITELGKSKLNEYLEQWFDFLDNVEQILGGKNG